MRISSPPTMVEKVSFFQELVVRDLGEGVGKGDHDGHCYAEVGKELELFVLG